MTTVTRKQLLSWDVLIAAEAPDVFTLIELLGREELAAHARVWLACCMLPPRAVAALAVDCAEHAIEGAAAYPSEMIAAMRSYLAGDVSKLPAEWNLAVASASVQIPRAVASAVDAAASCIAAVSAGAGDNAGDVADHECRARARVAIVAAECSAAYDERAVEAAWQLARAREYATRAELGVGQDPWATVCAASTAYERAVGAMDDARTCLGLAADDRRIATAEAVATAAVAVVVAARRYAAYRSDLLSADLARPSELREPGAPEPRDREEVSK